MLCFPNYDLHVVEGFVFWQSFPQNSGIMKQVQSQGAELEAMKPALHLPGNQQHRNFGCLLEGSYAVIVWKTSLRLQSVVACEAAELVSLQT